MYGNRDIYITVQTPSVGSEGGQGRKSSGRRDKDSEVERLRKEEKKEGTDREGIKCADGGAVVVELRKQCDVLNKTTLSSRPPYRSLAVPPLAVLSFSLCPSQSSLIECCQLCV